MMCTVFLERECENMGTCPGACTSFHDPGLGTIFLVVSCSKLISYPTLNAPLNFDSRQGGQGKQANMHAFVV